MAKIDLSKLDDTALVQIIESAPEKRRGLQIANMVVIGVCMVAAFTANLTRHSDSAGFLNPVLFCFISLVMIALDQIQSQIKALLQLYKNQQARLTELAAPQHLTQ